MTDSTFTGRVVGALLLVQLISGLILPYVLLHPVSVPAVAFLDTAAPMEGVIRLCMLMLLIGGAASLAISIAAWPVVRERQPRLGLCVLALAVMNFTLQLMENANWLSLLTMSQRHAEAAGAGGELFEGLAFAAYASWRWTHYSHILVVVGFLFAFYLLLYRGALIPPPLAAVALALPPLHFVGIILPVFAGYRMTNPDLFGAPLGVATVGIALWLMINGFRASPATQAPPAVKA